MDMAISSGSLLKEEEGSQYFSVLFFYRVIVGCICECDEEGEEQIITGFKR